MRLLKKLSYCPCWWNAKMHEQSTLNNHWQTLPWSNPVEYTLYHPSSLKRTTLAVTYLCLHSTANFSPLLGQLNAALKMHQPSTHNTHCKWQLQNVAKSLYHGHLIHPKHLKILLLPTTFIIKNNFTFLPLQSSHSSASWILNSLLKSNFWLLLIATPHLFEMITCTSMIFSLFNW